MPLNETSGNLTTDAFGGGVAVEPVYIEQIFSTWLYTGNGSTGQTISNGIDLSTNGGMVWAKSRSDAQTGFIFDTSRGSGKYLIPSATNASANGTPNGVTFLTNGFSTVDGIAPTYSNLCNQNGYTYASWTFRKQPKFFDVVTYTGTGSNTTISHALGSVPACIMVKRTDTAGAWQVYHRSLANTQYMVLNTTAAAATGATRWNSTTPTSSVFSVGTDATVNASGGTYVAYVFAHDAGGFGLTGTDNVISCGSWTGDATFNGSKSINLGWEPQFLLYKNASASTDWVIEDTMRGMPVSGADGNLLYPNLTSAEVATTSQAPNATGFSLYADNSSGNTYIYIAIRRGPMKVPTDSTKVFKPYAGADTPSITTNFPVDMFLDNNRNGNGNNTVNGSRLFDLNALRTAATDPESVGTFDLNCWQSNTSYLPNYFGVGESIVAYAFQRAPTYFDVCCFTGSGSNTTQTHNLGAVPELIIVKSRSATAAWQIYSSALANTEYLVLNTTAAKATGATRWNSTTPTSSVFSLGTSTTTNASATTYVAYLFSTCVGVSKVGSYTGNGTTQTINCGFTGGARFVMIKRTDSTGDWYIYDTARGMTVLTDPYSLLNTSAAETATLGSVTTVTTGFALNSNILAAINVSGGSYIFLAIS